MDMNESARAKMLTDKAEQTGQAEPPEQADFVSLADANRDLRRSRDLLSTILNTVQDGFLLLDSTGSVLAANQAMAALLETDADTLINQPWESFCRPAEPGKGKPGSAFPGLWVLYTLRDGQPRQQRERIAQHGKPPRVLDMEALPIFRTDSPDQSPPTVEHVVLHVVDVTEHLQMDALMIEHERFAASRRLTQIIAHEVNTPLQTILISIQMMMRKREQDQDYKLLHTARVEIERIGRILHQLKDLYHIQPDEPGPVNMNALIERVLLLTSGKLARQHIEVTSHLADNLPQFSGRADQLIQVLLNLILNALDAMPGGGTLVLRTWLSAETHAADDPPAPAVPEAASEAPAIVIEVADTGEGIDEQLRPRIFEPFFTTKEHGSGLGLSVSQKIIEDHQGHIDVRSQPGAGTTFVIRLPCNGGSYDRSYSRGRR